MLDFNIANWFWFIGEDEAQVWSSAAHGYVPVSDASYIAWQAEGGFAPRLAGQSELAEIVDKPIIEAIRSAEARQARPLREIGLGVEVVDNQARLWALDAEIAALRAQLVAISA